MAKKLEDTLREKYGNSKEDIILDGADFISQQGFTPIPNYILRTDKLDAKSKLVYATILSYAHGNKDRAFPGQTKLAQDCGLSIRSVSSAIKDLSDKRFVTVLRRGLTKTNVYILHFKKRW